MGNFLPVCCNWYLGGYRHGHLDFHAGENVRTLAFSVAHYWIVIHKYLLCIDVH